MRKILLLLCITLSSGFSQSIEGLISQAYEHSFVLKSMQQEVQINQQSIGVANSWDNPILSVGMGDIMFDDISNRSLEPMQTQYLTFSQTIPISNKKEIKKSLAQDVTILSKLQIQDKKAFIASNITYLAYQSIIIDERLALIDKKLKNLKTIKKLKRAYQKEQEHILEVTISILKLQNLKQTLQNRQDILYHEIEKFTVSSVLEVKDSLEIKELADVDINNHPKIKLLKQKVSLKHTKSALSKAKQKADIKVSGGYFQRDARDDYVNLSFSMPLQLYGVEKVQTSKAKLDILKAKEMLKEFKNSFEKEIVVLVKSMDIAEKDYHFYTDTLIPKQKKISRFLSRKSRLGKANLIDVIKNKNKIIALKEVALGALGDYFKAYAKLRYYR